MSPEKLCNHVWVINSKVVGHEFKGDQRVPVVKELPGERCARCGKLRTRQDEHEC